MSHRPSTLALGILLAQTVTAAPAWAGSTELVSVARGGGPGNGDSYTFRPAISADGRFVAFQSDASDLVPGDTNGTRDVFVRDQVAGTTERVSVGAGGAQADDQSGRPSISADGRHVAFDSLATNLVPGDTNGAGDVFVRDRRTGATTRVSVMSGGGQYRRGSEGPAISADGRFVAFTRFTGRALASGRVLVHDRGTGTTARVSVGPGGVANDFASSPAISASGRYVAFDTRASNLVPADTNGDIDVFVRDRGAGTTTRVSVGPGGAQVEGDSNVPALSADGRYVAFYSDAPGLVPNDTNGKPDVFVHDRQTGRTSRVSVATGGAQGDGISANPAISADGRYVAFESDASTLAPGDTNGTYDVFVHDRQTGTTTRVSVASEGSQSDGNSGGASLSGDGSSVTFVTEAADVVAGDRNGVADVFVRTR